MSNNNDEQLTSPEEGLEGYPLRLYAQALEYLSFMARDNPVSYSLAKLDSVKNLADVCQGIIDSRDGCEKDDPSAYYIAGRSLVRIANDMNQRGFLEGISKGCLGKPLELKDKTLLIGWVLGSTARDEIYRRSRRRGKHSESSFNNPADYIVS